MVIHLVQTLPFGLCSEFLHPFVFCESYLGLCLLASIDHSEESTPIRGNLLSVEKYVWSFYIYVGFAIHKSQVRI